MSPRGWAFITAFFSARKYAPSVTQGLRRLYGRDQLHFITCSGYRRLPESGTPERRDFLLEIPEETRRKYQFVV